MHPVLLPAPVKDTGGISHSSNQSHIVAALTTPPADARQADILLSAHSIWLHGTGAEGSTTGSSGVGVGGLFDGQPTNINALQIITESLSKIIFNFN